MQISDFQEGDVFIDTNFFYHYLRPPSQYMDQIIAFFQRIEVGRIHGFTSVGVFDELAYRRLLLYIKDQYGGNPFDLLRQQRQAMLQEFYPNVQEDLLAVRSFPNLETLPMTVIDLSQVIDDLTSVMLLPRDALHLAVMRNHGISCIATDDRDFDGVEGIERVWLYNPPLRKPMMVMIQRMNCRTGRGRLHESNHRVQQKGS